MYDFYIFVLMYWSMISFLGALGSGQCKTSLDCSLAGDCVQHTCVCDSWATGDACAYFNLKPLDPKRYGYRNESGFNSWGGHPIKINGTYHLYAAQILGHCPLSGYWSKYSTVIHATSPHFLGPYTMQSTVLPAFAHNPQVIVAPDGNILIYYVGWPNNQSTECNHSKFRHNMTMPSISTESPPIPSPNDIPTAAAGPMALAWSSSPYGPFQSKILWDSVEWHASGTNPTPYIYDNGTVMLTYARRWTVKDSKPPRHYKDTWLATAPHWSGPYSNVTQTNNASCKSGEDPFVFRTKRGYHMIAHDFGPAGGHLSYSLDGKIWTVNKVAAFNGTVVFTNGTSQNLCRRQRPQLYMENGIPIALWAGAMVPDPTGACEILPTYTIAQAFDA